MTTMTTDAPEGTTAKDDDGQGDGIELTEFEVFEVQSVKGVKAGANGFPHLLLKGLAETSAPAAEPAEIHGRPAWHAAAAALARMGHAAPMVDRGELFKAVNAAGEVDEGPDIDGGKQAIALIGKLIGFEAAELASGEVCEVEDIEMLCQAVYCLRAWLSRERAGAMAATDAAAMGCCASCIGADCGCCPACGAMGKAAADPELPGFLAGLTARYPDVEAQIKEIGDQLTAYAKDSRTFTAAERKKHAADGNALPDGSYPIPDKDALRRAAVLARSGHGDVAAARKLIARRAKELGVANPLDDDASKATGEPGVAEGATDVQTDAQDTGQPDIDELVGKAVAKALGPSEERIKALEGELAKAQADLQEWRDKPIPGGPLMSPLGASGAPKKDDVDHAAKAAYFERMAGTVSPDLAVHYRQLASDEKAKIPA